MIKDDLDFAIEVLLRAVRDLYDEMDFNDISAKDNLYSNYYDLKEILKDYEA